MKSWAGGQEMLWENSILQHIIFCFSSAYLPDASDA